MMATKAQSAEVPATADSVEGLRRRDYLKVGAVAFAGVGTVAALAPLLRRRDLLRALHPGHPDPAPFGTLRAHVARANYGIDAPNVIRTMGLLALALVGALVSRRLPREPREGGPSRA